MKDFEFYKTIRLSTSKKLDGAFSKLRNVYKVIPPTKGCLDSISREGGCGAWCCKIQTPQLLYSEFLLVWRSISKKWTDEEICDLFEKCMLNAVNEIPSKGCVFFDNETNMCRVHNVRPYNCRIYGITPDKEFNSRYDKLKKEYEKIPGAVIRPQCDLVSTVDGKDITSNDIMNWWARTVSADRFIGIPSEFITDKIGGSYRSSHDHVILYNLPENVLNSLAGIRMYDDPLEKIRTVSEMVSHIRNFFRGENQ